MCPASYLVHTERVMGCIACSSRQENTACRPRRQYPSGAVQDLRYGSQQRGRRAAGQQGSRAFDRSRRREINPCGPPGIDGGRRLSVMQASAAHTEREEGSREHVGALLESSDITALAGPSMLPGRQAPHSSAAQRLQLMDGQRQTQVPGSLLPGIRFFRAKARGVQTERAWDFSWPDRQRRASSRRPALTALSH